MKQLPTVIASPARDLAVEALEFDGAHRISNRDAVGFFFFLRLQPAAAPSRTAVLFSGTVMPVRPEVFGLPKMADREANFRTFAEAAIGDFIDDNGLPTFAPSGAAAANIECFSPHFQAWRDREPASDDLIAKYLFAHALWAWKFGHPSWTLRPSDLLRLNQPLPQVLRLVRLYETEAWTLTNESATGVTLTPTSSFLRQRVGRHPAPPTTALEATAVSPELSPADFVYVDEVRIADLRRLDTDRFDLRKLIALCEELNQCYRAQCYHAVAALTRAVIATCLLSLASAHSAR